MRSLIDQVISWDTIGPYEKEQYQYEITDAVIERETGVLTITLRLNFVMPALEMEKLSGVILHQFSDLKAVRFNYEYKDVMLTTEEIIPLFIPHMIQIVNGKYSAITKTIQTKKFEFDGEHLVIYALGRMSTEQLNDKVALQFRALLNTHFGIRCSVEFKNDESVYQAARESWRASEEADIKASLEEEKRKCAEARKAAAAGGGAAKSGGNSFGGNGGNGNAGGGGNGFGGGGFRRREKETPAEGNRIMGKDIFGDSVAISSIDQNSGSVILEGILFKKEGKVTKTGRVIATLLITDKKDSACLKTFCSQDKWSEIDSLLKNGEIGRAHV